MKYSVSPPPPPCDIWHDDVLFLPQLLVRDYEEELKHIGRFTDACREAPRGDIGGVSERETYDHFAYRFPASAVRTEFLMLDPKDCFHAVSQSLLNSFSDGRISILDVPCGAGASILGFLDLLAYLRSKQILCRLPVDLKITAGDYSQYARDLYDRMLTRAKPRLEQQGIRIEWQCVEWNAEMQSTTAALVDKWFQQGSDSEEWIVLVAAFSGEAMKDSNIAEAFAKNFEHIAARLYDRYGFLLWIEPCSNDAESWLKKVIKMFQGLLDIWGNSDGVLEHSFSWQHPFRPVTPTGRVRVLNFDRTGE
jgi:hypothetical protein